MKRLLFLALVPALAVLPVRADEAPKAVTVPFEILKSGHMTVKVKVNGKGPYTLIFDTGAPITLVNNKLARETGLLKNVARPAFAPFGAVAEVKVRSLEVGGQEARDVAAVVMDHPTVDAISRALGPIDGIVGFPFFARFRTTLDYQARTMTFVPSGFRPPDVMQALTAALLTTTGSSAAEPRMLTPAALWGLVPEADTGDGSDGLVLRDVLAGSPAAKAGLKAGDRLLTLDGRWTDSRADLYSAAAAIKPGTIATVRVRRDGKELTLTVKPVSGL